MSETKSLVSLSTKRLQMSCTKEVGLGGRIWIWKWTLVNFSRRTLTRSEGIV